MLILESWHKKPFRLRQWLVLFTCCIIFATGLTLTFLAFLGELALGKAYVQEIGSELSRSLASVAEFSIEEAEEFGNISRLHLSRYERNPTFYSKIATFIGDHISQNPGLSSAFYTDAETGFSIMAYPAEEKVSNSKYRPGSLFQTTRREKNTIYINEVKPVDGNKDQFEVRKFEADNYPEKALETNQIIGLDFRNREWFRKGANIQDSMEGVWLESYQFLYRGFKGSKNGLTYTVPIRNSNGKLDGVLGVDIPTDWFSDYLSSSLGKLEHRGIEAFIFEKRMDGTFVVIAHSQKENAFPRKENGEIKTLCQPDEMKKKVVPDMLASIPQRFKDYKDSDDSEMSMFNSNGEEMVGVVRDLFPGRPPQLVLCMYMSKHQLFAHAYHRARWNFVITLIVMGLSAVASMLISLATSKPLEGLALSADRIGKLDFKFGLGFQSRIFEVRNLSNSMQRMAIGLQSFIRYLPKSLLQNLFETGQGAVPGGAEKMITICFTDVENFTHYAESMPPNELVLQLNQYLGCFASTIDETQGTVDKYIGDAVMAYWNAPNDCADHPFMACQAAIGAMKKLEKFQEEWARSGKAVFRARVGINTGNAIVGNIGTEEHLNYTAIGDNINLASRLESLNKNYGTKILISESTFVAVGDRVVTRPVDLVAVKGKDIRVMVYELIGIRGEVDARTESLAVQFAEGHALYMKREWQQAECIFKSILASNPEDALCHLFAQRCSVFQSNPPDANWDGSQEFKTK